MCRISIPRVLNRCKTIVNTVLVAAVVATGLPAFGDDEVRGILIERIHDRPPFLVRVDVNHDSHVYEFGDVLEVTVVSEEPGYLYLIYCMADGKVCTLFPNEFDDDHRIEAHQPLTVPGPDAGFRMRIGPPAGDELLKAVVTRERLPVEVVRKLVEKTSKAIQENNEKGVFLEAVDRLDPSQWSEHQVKLRIVRTKGIQARRRVLLCVGIADFEDPNIVDLRVPVRDANEFANTMRSVGRLDQVIVLTNERATLANIKRAICETLANATNPGDTVFIYWSGHGGRCADDDPGEEKDRLDEYLVPRDGDSTDIDTIRKTMLLDDLFARWLLELDGRKIAVIIDTCYAAGAHKNAKGFGDPGPAPAGGFDFLDGEIARAKGIGLRQAVMLASADSDQLAFERREEDYSVMTYYLNKLLTDAVAPVTFQAAYHHVNATVQAYVKKRYHAVQTPRLEGECDVQIMLKP